MKNENEKSRIKLSRSDLGIIIDGLKDWIRVENNISHIEKKTWVDSLLLDLETAYDKNPNKDSFIFDLDANQISRLDDGISDNALYNNYEIEKSRKIAEYLEGILMKNYKKRPCYLVSHWNYILENIKNSNIKK